MFPTRSLRELLSIAVLNTLSNSLDRPAALLCVPQLVAHDVSAEVTRPFRLCLLARCRDPLLTMGLDILSSPNVIEVITGISTPDNVVDVP